MTGRLLLCLTLLALLLIPASAEETEQPALAAVLTEPAVLRTLPSADAPAAAELPEGTSLSITALGSAFCTAVWEQEGAAVTGYVALESLRFDVAGEGEACIGIVDVSPTNQYHGRVTLREKASTKSRSLTRLPKGTLVLVLGEEKGMKRVALPGFTGYVTRKHIASVKAVETTLAFVKNDAPVSLRLDSRYGEQWVITTLESGTPVQLIRNPNGWAQVEAAGYRGRMVAEYLTEEMP